MAKSLTKTTHAISLLKCWTADKKYLLLANSPHPDIAAIKTAVEANKNYSVDVQFIDDYTAKVAAYSLVILHQLPSNTNNANAQRVIAKMLMPPRNRLGLLQEP
jgi:hypothetical protein